jgi:hypothetical protein
MKFPLVGAHCQSSCKRDGGGFDPSRLGHGTSQFIDHSLLKAAVKACQKIIDYNNFWR